MDLGDIVPERRGSVGGVLDDKAIICGGWADDIHYTKDCYVIGHPTKTKTMLQNRSNAASVVLNDESGSKLWIVGGEDDKQFLSSTEFIKLDNSEALKGPDLNISITKHCAVKVNESAIFFIGGEQNETWTNKTWIVNPQKNFEMTEGPTMNKIRMYPACMLTKFNDELQIVVAGGKGEDHALSKSTEILNVNPFKRNEWVMGKISKTFKY